MLRSLLPDSRNQGSQAGVVSLRSEGWRTLLIVVGNEHLVIEMNRMAMDRTHAEKRLEIAPVATHLFEEPGALEKVAQLAAGWFARYLRPDESSGPAQ